MDSDRKYICWCCGEPDHFEYECPTEKKKCSRCKKGNIVHRIVKKDSPNKGRHFMTCSGINCRYFEWDDKVKQSNPGPDKAEQGEPSVIEKTDSNGTNNAVIGYLSDLLEKAVQVASKEEFNVEVKLSAIYSKSK